MYLHSFPGYGAYRVLFPMISVSQNDNLKKGVVAQGGSDPPAGGERLNSPYCHSLTTDS